MSNPRIGTTGRVKNLNKARGYGFIEPKIPGQKDLFLHASQVVTGEFDLLENGDIVEWEDVETTERGLMAIEVRLLTK